MPTVTPTPSALLRAFAGATRPLHARELFTRLGLPEGAYARVRELLDRLVLDGLLVEMPGQRFKVRAPKAQESDVETWEGVLSMNARGFGFVVAAGQDDVYVPPEALGGALHGDRVLVEVVGRGRRGVEGRVREVVARSRANVAGILRRRGKSVWLEPDDTRLRGPIVLAPGSREGKDGDGAVARIVRFPTRPEENPEGELLAVLGPPGEARTEVAKILLREGVEEEHSAAAVAEAERRCAELARHPPTRVDLTGVPLPTIDPEDARDHDDAVWVERQGTGYRVWVAIADVAEYVPAGGVLDAEAMARGCTVYLPDRAVPMLPRSLAGEACSLLPGVDRLCLCLVAELDAQARVQRFELVEGRMRSRCKLTYGGVARALGYTARPARSPAAESLREGLEVMAELTGKLRKARLARGALDLDLPEARVELHPETGRPVSITRRAEDPGVRRAYQMIEELMLLANFTVARFLGERRAPTVYRVHGKPDELKLARLAEVAALLGAPVEPGELAEPLGASRFLRSLARHPRQQVLEMLLLRALKQASYDVVNVGHFGLAADAYVHFTSPIRRYPDLVVHRTVKRLLRGERVTAEPPVVEALRAAATLASQRERAAMDVEREVVDLYRALYMKDHVGEVFEGTVVGLSGTGVYVSLSEPFIDVLVRFEALGPDHYSMTEDELALVGARSGDVVALGDPVTLEIEDVAVLRRQVYGRRVPPEAVLDAVERGRRLPARPPGSLGRAPAGTGGARRAGAARLEALPGGAAPGSPPVGAARQSRTVPRGPRRPGKATRGTPRARRKR